jgi:6,7-dimethyl-8-ribityllumazine synthase
MRQTEGTLDGTGLRLAAVVSRFHAEITGGLLAGALAEWAARGVDPDRIEVVHVPGALELPLAAAWLAARGDLDALVVLGAVIRGATDHYDYVCAETTRGCGRVALDHRLPVLFGVLTCDTLAQALERARPGPGNKGGEAAVAALAMATLGRRLAGKDA